MVIKREWRLIAIPFTVSLFFSSIYYYYEINSDLVILPLRRGKMKEVNGNVLPPQEMISEKERELLFAEWDKWAAVAAHADPQTSEGRKARDWAIFQINPIRQRLGL